MKPSSKYRVFLASLFLLLALCVGAVAQQTPPPPQAAPQQQPAQPLQPKQDASPIGITVGDTPEHVITGNEARELLSSVDAILRFDSTDTALPIKRDVKRELASRDQVQHYLESHMKDDKDTQRLQRSAVVLQKFGLLPRDFDLKIFLVQLLREQVAGYYDPKTRTVYLLNWLGPKVQLPVMAHELTHALQDQSFGLEKWLKDPDTDDLQQQIDADEQTSARHAVVEGQAMVSLMDYILAPSGQNVVNAPMLVEAMRIGMTSTDSSPVLGRAPMFIKEALTFPYNYGLNFEREVLVKRGKDAAFAGVFRNPPRTTRQVMEPATYLAGEKLAPLSVPDYDKIFGHDYKRFDVGSIGEFDVFVLLKQYAPEGGTRSVASQWRGGYYYSARPKDNPNALGLVFVTKWATPAAAQQFADIYSSYVPKRLNGATASGAAPVWHWKTSEGSITIEVRSDTLLVTESLSDDVTAKVASAVFGKSAVGN